MSLTGTRLGIRPPDPHKRPCPRCGVERKVHDGRADHPCADCQMVLRDLDEERAWDP